VIFAERLLIGLADIRKRLVAIGLIFFVVYMVLRWVHPAFSISPTPVIILIGFFMLSLGAIVIAWAIGSRNGIATADVVQAGITAIIWGTLGGKLAHCFLEARGHLLPDGSTATGVRDLFAAEQFLGRKGFGAPRAHGGKAGRR